MTDSMLGNNLLGLHIITSSLVSIILWNNLPNIILKDIYFVT